MTTVSVQATPPSQSPIVERLASGPLNADEATRLHDAMLVDVCRAVEDSGGDLVVAVRSGDQDNDEALSTVRDTLEPALVDPAEAEFTQQDDEDGERAHRLAKEVLRLHEAGVTSAAVVEPSAAFLARTTIDSAAMKLRSSEVVLGPAPDGRTYFAGFGEPMDLRDAFTPPELETLADIASDDVAVDFLHVLPVIEGPYDLTTAIPLLRARVAAGRRVPERTAEVVAELGLRIAERDGESSVVRETTT